MRAYPRYRDSGVEWLGDAPEHWEVKRLGIALVETVGGGTPNTTKEEFWAEVEEDGLPWVAIADMSAGGSVLDTEKKVTPAGAVAARLRSLPAGTIIYSMYASVGVVACLRIRAATNQAILGLLPSKSLHSSFLYWWLDAIRTPVLALTRSTTQDNLNAETVRRFPLFLPPLDEQRGIAAFLDRETERIDALVAKKRLLIERLQEYRTALITRTVTRGLPPEAARAAGLAPEPRLKPSGVEWLGDVPEHWEVANIRRYAEMKSGHTPSRQHPEYWEDCEIPWFTLADVWQLRDARKVHAGETKELISRVGLANSAAELLPAGTVMLSRTASIGFPGIMPVPMATSQDFWNWVCGSQLIPKYLFLLFDSMKKEFDRLMVGSTHRTIYEASAAGLRIPVPPTTEQHAIVGFLDERLPAIDGAGDVAAAAIERLQEYRTALITAAVTGKIDVRESACEQIAAQ